MVSLIAFTDISFKRKISLIVLDLSYADLGGLGLVNAFYPKFPTYIGILTGYSDLAMAKVVYKAGVYGTNSSQEKDKSTFFSINYHFCI